MMTRMTRVSIPFIAGQWSLLAAIRAGGGEARAFQSPSLRGSGRFRKNEPHYIGAPGVSIPFIAGQWSLPDRERAQARARKVSIPFIAGQWSLPTTAVWRAWQEAGFNPLHCGAVVAST